MSDTFEAAKRLGITKSDFMDDWWVGFSPRNGMAGQAEGYWCQWVHLARLILADPRTAEQMPDHAMPYDSPVKSGNPNYLGAEHHPECKEH